MKLNANRLQQWADKNHVQQPLHELSLNQMQKAATDLKVDLGEVIGVREDMILTQASQLEQAGAGSARDRDAAQGAAAGFGGVSSETSPMMGGHQFRDATFPNARADDAGQAMDAFQRFNDDAKSRFYPKYQGYKGGNDSMDAFFKSNYSIADAEAAMKAFPFLHDVGDAKQYIGVLVNSGRTDELRQHGITPSQYDHHDQKEVFFDSQYTYDDACEAMAALPFLHSVDDAKAYIGLKVMNGSESILSEVGVKPGRDALSDMDRYLESGYSFKDAEDAVQAFDFLHNVDEAKNYIGLKIANKTEYILGEKKIFPHDADHSVYVDLFDKSGYTTDDAKAAMQAFGCADLNEAKDLMGYKIATGWESQLADVGIKPGWGDDELRAFKKSGYTEIDVRQALVAFGFLNSIDEAREYIGLKVLNGNEKMLADNGITRGRWDTHEELRAFGDSGYTKEDAMKVMKAFDFIDSVDDARAYIGLKVLNDTEFILQDAGVKPRFDYYSDHDVKPAINPMIDGVPDDDLS
jgi:hypothetical protein